MNNFALMIPIPSKQLKTYNGIRLWPFLLVKDKEYVKDLVCINHEHIHAAQQKELVIIFFYTWYGTDYLIRLLRFKNHFLAYRNIVFEREAYSNEASLHYLKSRKLFSFLKFYSKKYAYE
ncbi:hypothetical protein F0365_00790 [Nonlabens sp. Ci31]|uniref:hypothetical protein n=1 Tax=Nonlabens sp. Ci31 TaxID=2608253 RepID=UPI0014636080|nr:hypothetical protein [Nonlabens sp. Ci31]QJP33051.1 hypothetical protein F0365_00790 [Nonlabens sp. Ci31]